MERSKERKLRLWWECDDKGTGAVGSKGIAAASGVVGVVGAELWPNDDDVQEAEDVLAPILRPILAPRRFSRENGLREVDAGIPDVEPPGREKYDGLSENIKNKRIHMTNLYCPYAIYQRYLIAEFA
jgi:hypothetical protein